MDKLISESYASYVECTFKKLLSHLTPVDTTTFKYTQTKAHGKILSLDSGRLLKARFGGFADLLSEIQDCHTQITVTDEEWRRKVTQEGIDMLCDKYQSFFSEYSKYPFSKKNQDEYLRFPPMILRGILEGLLSAV